MMGGCGVRNKRNSNTRCMLLNQRVLSVRESTRCSGHLGLIVTIILLKSDGSGVVEVGSKTKRSFTVIIECFAVVQRIIQASVPPDERNKATKLNNRLGLKQDEPRSGVSLIGYMHLLGHITKSSVLQLAF